MTTNRITMMEIYEDVIHLLEALTYAVKSDDENLIRLLTDKVSADVKIKCNADEIPDDLRYTVIELVCGEFLFIKKGSGQLSGFDIHSAVKQIKDGDATVTFAVSDADLSVDALIRRLKDKPDQMFARFRRLVW